MEFWLGRTLKSAKKTIGSRDDFLESEDGFKAKFMTGPFRGRNVPGGRFSRDRLLSDLDLYVIEPSDRASDFFNRNRIGGTDIIGTAGFSKGERRPKPPREFPCV
jgi:hypothetical protein